MGERCLQESELYLMLEENTLEFFRQISKSYLSGVSSSDEDGNEILVEGKVYDIFLSRLSECDIEDLVIETGTTDPKVEFWYKDGVPSECDTDLDVNYVAFNPEIFDCNTTNHEDA